MITTRLAGGLGNQLFQYAAGRAVAAACTDTLQLDTRATIAGTHAEYALDHFAIPALVATSAKLPPAKNRPIPYAMWRYLGQSPKILREKGLGFDPSILENCGDHYLHGYWQTDKYFRSIGPLLRAELAIITPPSAENAQALEDIAKTRSVSLHVRRGDYVSVQKNSSIYGTCDAAYYDRALAHMVEKCSDDFTVYVFSNDPDWARENLSFDHETRIFDHNGSDKHYEDLRLMSACEHNIIVNSTFSWWGAWLNPSTRKQVVAPSNWFQGDKVINPDIIPEEWHQL